MLVQAIRIRNRPEHYQNYDDKTHRNRNSNQSLGFLISLGFFSPSGITNNTSLYLFSSSVTFMQADLMTIAIIFVASPTKNGSKYISIVTPATNTPIFIAALTTNPTSIPQKAPIYVTLLLQTLAGATGSQDK